MLEINKISIRAKRIGSAYARCMEIIRKHRYTSKLFSLYGEQIKNPIQLQSILNQLKDTIYQLPESIDNSIKYQAAKRFLDRILTDNYIFIDSKSQITIKQLLGLAFLAISEDSKRIGSLHDAIIEIFISGLHEIQQ